MTIMSAHTPTPWVVCNGTDIIVGTKQDGRVLGQMRLADDAEFVARACNAHNDLLASLLAVAACLDMGRLSDTIREAIKKATHSQGGTSTREGRNGTK